MSGRDEETNVPEVRLRGTSWILATNSPYARHFSLNAID